MIVKDSILYARTISPVSGKYEKQDTFLMAALKVIGGAIVLTLAIGIIFTFFYAL